MKILTGIPTRGRRSAPALAEQFSHYSDVLIVAQETDLPESPHYRLVEQEPGLANARNFIFRYALRNNYDAVCQCDDDITFKPEVLSNYFATVCELLPRGVASVCSKARIYQFWDGPSKSNKDYEIIPRLQQCWTISTEAVSALGSFYLETLEDVEYSLRLINGGCIPVQVSKPGMVHGHSVKRDKGAELGGQPVSERLHHIDYAIESINKKYDFAFVTRKKEGSFSCKLDWKLIGSRLPYLGLGYEDKRGIRC